MPAGKSGYTVPGRFPASPPWENEAVIRSAELLFILGALFLLDIITTQIILRMGGVELNPVMAGIVSNPALHLIIKAVMLLVIFAVSLIAEQRVKGSGIFFYGVLILLYSVVVFNNLLFILPRIGT